MHKYERLERLYYKKKLIKISLWIIFIVFVSIGINLAYLGFKKENKTAKKHLKNNKEINISVKHQTISFKKTYEKKIKNKTQHKSILQLVNKYKEKNSSKILTLEFVLPKIDEVNLKLPQESLNKIKDKKRESKEEKKSNVVRNLQKKVENKPIIIEEDNASISDLIKSFNESPSFDLAIQISQFYLNKGYISLAKKWALKANSINPDRYESWKLFAIILLKMNKKEQAKEVLKTYLNDYGNNDEIRKLLRSIE